MTRPNGPVPLSKLPPKRPPSEAPWSARSLLKEDGETTTENAENTEDL
jgi:hypothetical protein